ncbi:family 16 glycosylhydrolase [Mycobacterium sp. M26]|uniref:family 16 glycosylhydrolase n=1 Tax=Mycobacterium sp. M26 TaxID=1762962 RepID=UPI000AA3437C|nr:family 16 glycosylhydrolase [Mycobacterium sp. M26]
MNAIVVGRVGALAIALGIGTAIATGVGCAVAAAETGDSTGGPAHTSSAGHSPRAKSAAAQGAVTRARPAPKVSAPVSSTSPAGPADTATAVLLSAARRERATAAAASRKGAAQVAASTTVSSVEAESMTVTPTASARVISDANASGGAALALTDNGTASATVALAASNGLVIRAKASLSSGPPNLALAIDGVAVTTIMVNATSWSNYTFAGAIPAGTHTLSITYSNNYDASSTSQRNLYLDSISTINGAVGDEFLGSAGAAPNSALWTIKTGTGWDPGVENYTTKNVTLDGQGHLVISATKTGRGYASGWIESKNKLSMGYGTIIARIKVPKGQGLWPAFWLKGADEDTTAWPQSGEVDVLELPSTTTTVYSTLHGPISGTTATQQAQIIANLPDLSTDYHDFWVRHLENEITFGVDGTTLGTLTPESLSPGSTWVYNRPMFAILNLAVGGPWAGAPNSSTRFPAKMLIDSVQWVPA